MSGTTAAGRPDPRLFWVAAFLVLVVDFISKRIAERLLFPPHVPHEILGNVVRFTLAYNPGAAFSMSLGAWSRYVFGAFAVIALLVLWRLYRDARPGERLKVFALGMAWGGAAGNLVDRLRSRLGVVDFIDVGIGDTRFWTFNVADSAVTIGAVLLAWVLLREEQGQRREPKAAASPPSNAA